MQKKKMQCQNYVLDNKHGKIYLNALTVYNSSHRVKHWGLNQMNANYSAKKYIAQMIKDWNIRIGTGDNRMTILGFPLRNETNGWK